MLRKNGSPIENWNIGCASRRPPMRKICAVTGGSEAGVPRIAMRTAGSLASAGSSFMATVSAGAWRLAGAGSDTAVAVGVAFEFEVGFEVVLDVVAAASSARAAYMGGAIIGRP